MIIYLVWSKLLLRPIQLLKMVYEFIKWMLYPLRRQKFPNDFLYTIKNHRNKIFLKINGLQNNIIYILLFRITDNINLVFTTSSNFIIFWPYLWKFGFHACWMGPSSVWALMLVTWTCNLNSKSMSHPARLTTDPRLEWLNWSN